MKESKIIVPMAETEICETTKVRDQKICNMVTNMSNLRGRITIEKQNLIRQEEELLQYLINNQLYHFLKVDLNSLYKMGY